MKSIFATVVVLVLAASAPGQGTVDFRNTPTTQISTNDLQGHSGLTQGAGNYRMGLYWGPFGTAEGSMTLAQLEPNLATPGLFGTGSLVPIPFPGGSQVSFQVRAWSAAAGNSYEEALSYALGGGSPTAYLGKSTTGSFTVGTGTVVIFGTGPGQVGGFVLSPIPEPGTWVLLGVGLAFFAWNRGRR